MSKQVEYVRDVARRGAIEGLHAEVRVQMALATQALEYGRVEYSASGSEYVAMINAKLEAALAHIDSARFVVSELERMGQ